VFLPVLDEFLLTSVHVWEKKIRFIKSDKIVDTHFKKEKKWFSRNISGEMWSQAICVWDTLIQVNQSNSASV
jgi:hypothetical protein